MRSNHLYILHLVIITLGCCILSSCSDGMQANRLYEDKNILRIAVPSDPRSLDPAIAYDVVTWPLVRTIFHGLIDYDDDLNLFPWPSKLNPTTVKIIAMPGTIVMWGETIK